MRDRTGLLLLCFVVLWWAAVALLAVALLSGWPIFALAFLGGFVGASAISIFGAMGDLVRHGIWNDRL